MSFHPLRQILRWAENRGVDFLPPNFIIQDQRVKRLPTVWSQLYLNGLGLAAGDGSALRVQGIQYPLHRPHQDRDDAAARYASRVAIVPIGAPARRRQVDSADRVCFAGRVWRQPS